MMATFSSYRLWAVLWGTSSCVCESRFNCNLYIFILSFFDTTSLDDHCLSLSTSKLLTCSCSIQCQVKSVCYHHHHLSRTWPVSTFSSRDHSMPLPRPLDCPPTFLPRLQQVSIASELDHTHLGAMTGIYFSPPPRGRTRNSPC